MKKTIRKSEHIRIWNKDLEKLHSIQILLSLRRGKIINKIEVLNYLLDEAFQNLIDEKNIGKGR